MRLKSIVITYDIYTMLKEYMIKNKLKSLSDTISKLLLKEEDEDELTKIMKEKMKQIEQRRLKNDNKIFR